MIDAREQNAFAALSGSRVVTDELAKRIEDAMWAADTATLYRIAPCECCCDEHTFESCKARLWHGCRGQNSMMDAELAAWLRHYERSHGMTMEEFFA